MDKVCPLSSHTYLSCNQIFSIWRESKCCNCFPKTEKRTLRNFSNMWFHFITSRLGSQLGWTGKRLKITHNSLTQWFSLTRGLTLAMGIPCCPSLKQHAYSTRKAPKVEVHPCAFIPGPCPSPGFNNKVIVLGGEKKKSPIPWSSTKISSMSCLSAVPHGTSMFMRWYLISNSTSH